MQQAIGELLPLAVAVSISPLPIIAMIVLLMSPHARTSTPAFMLGWILAIATVLVVAALLSDAFGGRNVGASAPIVPAIKLLLGGTMLYMAWREWHARPKAGHRAELPHWLTTVEHMGPLAAAGTGFGIYAANPKNLTVGVSAAVLFQSFGMPAGAALIVGTLYVLVASSTVVLPILASRCRGQGETLAERAARLARAAQRGCHGCAALRHRRSHGGQRHRGILTTDCQEGMYCVSVTRRASSVVPLEIAVDATFLQPFLTYTTAAAVTFAVNAEAQANWEADDTWTVPIHST
ncbi:MAG: GAP family protein, partial [Solimonas sp.]